MRRISTQVIFETKTGSWTGDRRMKENGILLAHIKKHHTQDCDVNGCTATIAFRKKDQTARAAICKAFFPPILDGKNIVVALEKNLCPFCETARAENIKAACLANDGHGRQAVHVPDDSAYRYAIDAAGRLTRQPALPSGGTQNPEWFDFRKGFWMTGS